MGLDHRIAYSGTLDSAAMKGFTLLVGALALLVSAGCGSSSSQGSGNTTVGPVAATVSDTILVGTDPVAIALDPSANQIYVANFGGTPASNLSAPSSCLATGGSVTMIDGATESTTVIDYPEANPVAVAVDPVKHAAYVTRWQGEPALAGHGGCNVFPFFAVINQTTGGYILIPGGPGTTALNAQTGEAYVASPCCKTISVIQYGANIPRTLVSVGTTPTGLAVDETTNKIYVADQGDNAISVIEGATNSVSTLPDSGGTAPDAVAVNSATNTIYVANHGSNNVSVIGGFTGSLAATVTVGTSPVAVAVDAQRNLIYVANAGSSQTGDPGSVTIIDGATNATTTLTDPKALHPSAVAVNPVTNKIYVANSGSNNVTVIDGAHH